MSEGVHHSRSTLRLECRGQDGLTRLNNSRHNKPSQLRIVEQQVVLVSSNIKLFQYKARIAAREIDPMTGEHAAKSEANAAEIG